MKTDFLHGLATATGIQAAQATQTASCLIGKTPAIDALRKAELVEICRIFDAPVDQVVALAASRRAMQDQAFATELQRVAAWIRAIENVNAVDERQLRALARGAAGPLVEDAPAPADAPSARAAPANGDLIERLHAGGAAIGPWPYRTSEPITLTVPSYCTPDGAAWCANCGEPCPFCPARPADAPSARAAPANDGLVEAQQWQLEEICRAFSPPPAQRARKMPAAIAEIEASVDDQLRRHAESRTCPEPDELLPLLSSAESRKNSRTIVGQACSDLIWQTKIPAGSILSTPWVAGSNPAGIAIASRQKTPIIKGLSRFRRLVRYTNGLEREGIKRDNSGQVGRQSPEQSPELIDERIGARILCALLGGLRLAAAFLGLRQA